MSILNFLIKQKTKMCLQFINLYKYIDYIPLQFNSISALHIVNLIKFFFFNFQYCLAIIFV